MLTQQYGPMQELFTFGTGGNGQQLAHGGQEYELVPRLVEALAVKKAVGASAGSMLA